LEKTGPHHYRIYRPEKYFKPVDYKDTVHIDRIKPYHERIGRAVDPIYLMGNEDQAEFLPNVAVPIGPPDTDDAIQAITVKRKAQLHQEIPMIGTFKPPEVEATYEEIQTSPPKMEKTPSKVPQSDRVLRSTIKKVFNKITAPFK
jgi:hypothetical protein